MGPSCQWNILLLYRFLRQIWGYVWDLAFLAPCSLSPCSLKGSYLSSKNSIISHFINSLPIKGTRSIVNCQTKASSLPNQVSWNVEWRQMMRTRSESLPPEARFNIFKNNWISTIVLEDQRKCLWCPISQLELIVFWTIQEEKSCPYHMDKHQDMLTRSDMSYS